MMLHKDIYRRIVSTKMFMDDHFERDINLDQLSRQASLSKFHFHRLFTAVYRKTPHQYLTGTRLNAAARLLREENGMTASDVCYAIGFESVNSFCLLFRRLYGCTPCSSGRQSRKRNRLWSGNPFSSFRIVSFSLIFLKNSNIR